MLLPPRLLNIVVTKKLEQVDMKAEAEKGNAKKAEVETQRKATRTEL